MPCAGHRTVCDYGKSALRRVAYRRNLIEVGEHELLLFRDLTDDIVNIFVFILIKIAHIKLIARARRAK